MSVRGCVAPSNCVSGHIFALWPDDAYALFPFNILPRLQLEEIDTGYMVGHCGIDALLCLTYHIF